MTQKQLGRAQMVAIVKHLQDHHIKMAFIQMHIEVYRMWLRMLIHIQMVILFVLLVILILVKRLEVGINLFNNIQIFRQYHPSLVTFWFALSLC